MRVYQKKTASQIEIRLNYFRIVILLIPLFSILPFLGMLVLSGVKMSRKLQIFTLKPSFTVKMQEKSLIFTIYTPYIMGMRILYREKVS